jgi:MFS family permease
LYYNKVGGLPGELWIVQAGVFFNFLGWGCVMPFEVIYLHDGRGFGLGISGLIVGTVTGLAVVGAPVAGPLIDRIGSRATATGALVFLGFGFAGLAVARTVPGAFLAAAVAGLGNGGLLPSQSALLAGLVAPELRHRATAVSRVASNINATTYWLYALILRLGVHRDVPPDPLPGGYRVVLRDRPFVSLAAINVAIIAVGWGFFSWIVPVYARTTIGVSTRVVGAMVLANAVTVVVAQLPVARLAEGRRRAATMCAGALAFVGAALLVLAAHRLELRLAATALLLSAVVVAIGECLHTTVLMPLVADLAPPALRGRYMAVTGLSWWLGLALAPTLAAQLLSVSPAAALLTAAGVASAAAVAALALERQLPLSVRLTPLPA